MKVASQRYSKMQKYLDFYYECISQENIFFHKIFIHTNHTKGDSPVGKKSVCCLFCMCVNLSLNSHHPHKKPRMAAYVCNPHDRGQ